jgi:glycosyltransferase involved in cell wall biosynthesis
MVVITNILNPNTSFELQDYNLLSKHFLTSIIVKPRNNKDIIRYATELKKSIKSTDIVFGWFANWYTYLGLKLCQHYNKKMIVVTGGYDVANEPDLNYGAFHHLKDKIPALYVLKNADLILSVSKFNQKEMLIRTIPKDNEMIYNGIDTAYFIPKDKKYLTVMTVCSDDKKAQLRKGINNFINSGNTFDTIPFHWFGKSHISNDRLLEAYQKTQFYVQPSYYEAFGMSVIESMSCNCIPIVSKNSALPEVVEDCGLIMNENTTNDITTSIQTLLDNYNLKAESEKCRKRIVENFNVKDREKSLKRIIEQMTK